VHIGREEKREERREKREEKRGRCDLRYVPARLPLSLFVFEQAGHMTSQSYLSASIEAASTDTSGDLTVVQLDGLVCISVPISQYAY
jgi:hypothetical protein